jgi:endonuclease YncB( thermonuclease family)
MNRPKPDLPAAAPPPARWAALIAPCLLAAATAVAAPRGKPPEPVEGVINRVIDGDSLTLQPEGKPPIKVRLRDMDAPEICQPHGPEAKKALEEFALGKKAVLTASGRDSYGNTVGLLTVDGQSVSKWMVAEGHAWSTRSRYDRGPLMKEERMAIALKRGLHATQGAVLPREFRKTHGPCK